MRNAGVILTSLSLIGALVLGCNSNHNKDAGSTPVAAPGPVTGKFAYVNIDTFESKYDVLKAKQDEFKKRQDEMDNELQLSYKQMQDYASKVQGKVQSNSITQSEYQEAEQKLMQQQKSLEARRQSLTDELLKAKDDFNKELKSRLDAFLATYNKDKNFDFIFTYTSSGGSPLLYANRSLDITKDVVDGMNAAAKNDDKKKNK